MENLVQMDNQPISATFFDEGKWLSEFITPNNLEVQLAHKGITKNITNQRDRIVALWRWVAHEVKYKPFITGKVNIEGRQSVKDDIWNEPGLTARVRVGNCSNKAFLLTSLLRNEMSDTQVYCVLGNLNGDSPGGHAWVQVTMPDGEYIMESTRDDIQPFICLTCDSHYEAVHLFNDRQMFAVPGRVVMKPFAACYSPWLKDYLDWEFIRGRK